MKKFPIMLVRATRQVLGCDNKFFGWKKVIVGLRDLCKGLFCGTRGEGLVSLVPTFASLVATKSPKWQKLFFHEKSVIFGLRDLWKGLVVAREVRGWCHECHFLHHEGRRVSSKSPEWCKKWHEWHHPLTSSATKRPFQWSRRPKQLIFSGIFFSSPWTFFRHLWCKSWHSWPHPPHPSCHKKALSMVSKAKETDRQRKKSFSLLSFFPFTQPMG